MNWLAHLFLSPCNTDCQLGNLLADRLKGRADASVSEAFQQGLQLHKVIDAFTDSHPVVSESKARLGDKGVLKPVVIDLVYDHCLSRLWPEFADTDLRCFLDDFYASTPRSTSVVNEEKFVRRLIQYDVLASYGDWDGLTLTFLRMDTRLSQRLAEREKVSDYLPVVAREREHIENDFIAFFPELQQHVQTSFPELSFPHWLAYRDAG